MENRSDRLRKAREDAGYEHAKDAAEAMGIPAATYIQHENGRGKGGFPLVHAERYARKFKVTTEWLIYGRGERDRQDALPSVSKIEGMIEEAQGSLPVTATIADYAKHVAPRLLEQLERYLESKAAKRA